jgi:hypothetical protein
MTAWLQAVTEGRTVTSHDRSDAGLSPPGMGFKPGIVYLGFVIIIIYLLTAIGLSPGGSIHLHKIQYTEQHK